MNITKDEFEKSKKNFIKYRRLMGKNQEIMMTYIRNGGGELPAEYSTPVEHLGFGVRLLNILRSGRIETFGDLCRSTPTDLYKLRGFGQKNLREMKEFLDSKGIRWGEIGLVNGYIQSELDHKIATWRFR
jgi:DNA-directed RNA polymerase alpha subunit